jgi:hypothetical protein
LGVVAVKENVEYIGKIDVCTRLNPIDSQECSQDYWPSFRCLVSGSIENPSFFDLKSVDRTFVIVRASLSVSFAISMVFPMCCILLYVLFFWFRCRVSHAGEKEYEIHVDGSDELKELFSERLVLSFLRRTSVGNSESVKLIHSQYIGLFVNGIFCGVALFTAIAVFGSIGVTIGILLGMTTLSLAFVLLLGASMVMCSIPMVCGFVPHSMLLRKYVLWTETRIITLEVGRFSRSIKFYSFNEIKEVGSNVKEVESMRTDPTLSLRLKDGRHVQVCHLAQHELQTYLDYTLTHSPYATESVMTVHDD